MEEVRTPWMKNFGDTPASLDYFGGTMFEAVEEAARLYPKYAALDFMGSVVTYVQLTAQIRRCAKALRAIGIREGDRVTVCMPNVPQAVVMLYAVNLAGAVANMIHPLSAEKEIENYLEVSKSSACLALDLFYPKLAEINKSKTIKNLIITSVKDALPPLTKAGYALTEGRKVKKLPKDAPVIRWRDFLKGGDNFVGDYRTRRKPEDPAVILYSGGTTGTTKGILLSNLNFNALGAQVRATNPMFEPGDKMLAVMPVFHGFGLGVCVHSMLMQGGRCQLIPRFNIQTYAKLLKKLRPNLIAGVPTLYEALLRVPDMEGIDLSCLKGVFSGGDSLSADLKKRLDKFLAGHNAAVQVREGYGTTECVTASCLTPYHTAKEGSIGIPFPDTYYKIVAAGSCDEVPYGTEGEICLSGPSVMLGYLDNPEETAAALKTHKDGLKWLHTGDLGVMDEDGFLYFRQRIKRMIVTSGYSVYPSQIENVLDSHEYVHMSCVIGVPDAYKVQKVKAFVMLVPGISPGEDVCAELLRWCAKRVAKYALPCEIEFRDSLPTTLVGKVAYRELEEQELNKSINGG